jgi:hypothetical protein
LKIKQLTRAAYNKRLCPSINALFNLIVFLRTDYPWWSIQVRIPVGIDGLRIYLVESPINYCRRFPARVESTIINLLDSLIDDHIAEVTKLSLDYVLKQKEGEDSDDED